jgi:murein DD-endopeptidase MepM/ murein hydrolase activator NlpD
VILPHRKTFTFIFTSLVSFLCAAFLPASVGAQARTSAACEDGVKLQLSAPLSLQGTLLRVAVRTTSPATEVNGEWAGHAVSFWQDDKEGKVHRAFLGIDLEQKAGPGEFKVTAKPSTGESVDCVAKVTVRAGRFALEKLTVAPEFVEPPAQELERLKKESERLRAIYAARSPEEMWKGAFRFPLDGPRRGGNFGRRRVLNGQPRSPHGGLDIPAPTGTPIHAAQRGRVALAEEFYFSGNTIIVDHGLGVYTFYGHLSEIGVKAGEVVNAGALIGKVGATGRVTGPHLHWGLIVNESRVNPLQILPSEKPQK